MLIGKEINHYPFADEVKNGQKKSDEEFQKQQKNPVPNTQYRTKKKQNSPIQI